MTAIINGSVNNLTGSIKYNGWEFKGPRFIWHIKMNPVDTGDGRATAFNQYTLTLRAIVTDDYNGTESHLGVYAGGQTALQNSTRNARSNIQLIRALLSKNGQALIIKGLGFDIRLNDGNYGSVYDVRFGPRTKSLSLQPIGGGVVWQVDWVLEFVLPECYAYQNGNLAYTDGLGGSTDVSYIQFPYSGLSTPGNPQIESLVSEVHYEIDRYGLTTRIIDGYIVMPANRASATGMGTQNQLVGTCDDLRNKITPMVPTNFQRIGYDWHLSADRTKLTFRIADKELGTDNSFPKGVIDMHLEHTVNMGGTNMALAGASPAVINNKFFGYIDVAKKVSMGIAFDTVILMMQQRINAQISNGGNNDQAVYITNVTLSEIIIGPFRRLSFNMTYYTRLLSGTDPIATSGLIQRAALFTPVDQGISNWNNWAASLGDTFDVSSAVTDQGNAWSKRGFAGLAFTPAEDPIVAPCYGNPYSLPADYQAGTYISSGMGSLVTKCPGKGNDYYLTRSAITIMCDNKTIVSCPMTTAAIGVSDSAAITDTGDPTVNRAINYKAPKIGIRSSAGIAGSIITVIMNGYAERFGVNPEIPSINTTKFREQISNGTLVPIGKTQIGDAVGKRLGPCLLFCRSWKMKYKFIGISSATTISAVIDAFAKSVMATDSDDSTKLTKTGGTNTGTT